MTEQRGWPYEPVDTRTQPQPVAAEPVVLSVRPEAPTAPEPHAPALRPRVLAVLAVVGVVALVLGVFTVFDWYARNQELDLLLVRIERAERSQDLPKEVFNQVVRDCSVGFGLVVGECDRAAIARAAVLALPDLEETGAAVAGTRLPRHHRSLRTLRDRYVEHNLAWRAWLTSLASAESEDINPPASIGITFRAAGAAARRAVPAFPLHDNRRRVAEIFHDV